MNIEHVHVDVWNISHNKKHDFDRCVFCKEVLDRGIHISDVTHFSWLSNPSLPHITTFHTIIIFMTKMVSHLWMAQKVDRNVVVCTFLCPNREASATIDVVSRSYSLNENMIDTWSGIRICVVTSKTIFLFSKYAKENVLTGLFQKYKLSCKGRKVNCCACKL